MKNTNNLSHLADIDKFCEDTWEDLKKYIIGALDEFSIDDPFFVDEESHLIKCHNIIIYPEVQYFMTIGGQRKYSSWQVSGMDLLDENKDLDYGNETTASRAAKCFFTALMDYKLTNYWEKISND